MGAATTVGRAGPQAAVARRLRRLSSLQGALDGLQAELDGELDMVRARYAGRIDRLTRRMGRLRDDLEQHCRADREAILPPGRKSLSTPYGEVGFRSAEPSLVVADGRCDADVCRMLRSARLGRLVRIKESPDKPAARKALADGRVSARKLAACGLVLQRLPDRFHCRICRDALVHVGATAR